MVEELIEGIAKLSKIPDCVMKKYDSSKYILQYMNDTIQIDEISLKKLITRIDDLNQCLNMMKNKVEDEYIMISYHDGNILSFKRKLST